MKTEGAFLVPTLSTYAALADEGERLGWSAEMLGKLATVSARGIESVQLAVSEGVPVVFGTDLLGHMHDRQSGEFDLRAAGDVAGADAAKRDLHRGAAAAAKRVIWVS